MALADVQGLTGGPKCVTIEKTRKRDGQMDRVLIRDLKLQEAGILKELLYEAIFQPNPAQLLPKDVVESPELSVYIENWGRKDDICLAAEVGGCIAGAVWTRVFAQAVKGYGCLDGQTPELAAALFPEFRGRGIGIALVGQMLQRLKERGYSMVSLSVAKENLAARALYRRFDFETVEDCGEELILAACLKQRHFPETTDQGRA